MIVLLKVEPLVYFGSVNQWVVMAAGGLQNKERLVCADLTGITHVIGATYMPCDKLNSKPMARRYLTMRSLYA